MNDFCSISIADKDTFNEVAIIVDKPFYQQEQKKLRRIFGFPIMPDNFLKWKEINNDVELTSDQDIKFTQWFCQLKLPSISNHVDNYENLIWTKNYYIQKERIFSRSKALEVAAIHLSSYFNKNWQLFSPFLEMGIATNLISNIKEKQAFLTLYTPPTDSKKIKEELNPYRDLFLLPDDISFALFFSRNTPLHQLRSLLSDKLPKLQERYDNEIGKNRRWLSFYRKASLENSRNLYIKFSEVKRNNKKLSNEKCYKIIAREELHNQKRNPDEIQSNGTIVVETEKNRIKEAIETYTKLLKTP